MIPAFDAAWDVISRDTPLNLIPPRRPIPPSLPTILPRVRLEYFHPTFAALRDAGADPIHGASGALFLVFMDSILNVQNVRKS